MYRQIYPLNEQVLSSSIDLPRTLDRTQLPDKQKMMVISNNNNNFNRNTTSGDSRQTAEQIKNQIKTIEDEVRLLRQGMTHNVNLPISKAKGNANSSNKVDYNFNKSGTVKESKQNDMNENGYDDRPLEVNGTSLQELQLTNTHLHHPEINNQYNQANNNYNINNKQMESVRANAHPIKQNINSSDNKNRYNYSSGIPIRKPSVSKRSQSMPSRPVSARSANSRNNNVHIAFGHRVYPASESHTQRQSHLRNFTSQNDIGGQTNEQNNFQNIIKSRNSSNRVIKVHNSKRNREARPQSAKSSRATKEVETAVHTPHKKEEHDFITTQNKNNNNNVDSNKKEHEIFTHNTYWGSSARALEIKNSPFTHYKQNVDYSVNVPHKTSLETDSKLKYKEEQEHLREHEEEQHKVHLTPLKRDERQINKTEEKLTAYAKEQEENVNQTAVSDKNDVVKSLQSQVHNLQKELQERDDLLRNATRALVNVECDKLAVNNNDNNNENKGNKLESLTLQHTTPSKNTVVHDKSREPHKELQELQNIENNKGEEIRNTKKKGNESIEKTNTLAVINTVAQNKLDHDDNNNYISNENNKTQLVCEDYDELSTQMHHVQLNLSHAQNELHAIHEKCILSQEREAELRVQLMHREQEKERMETEMKRLLVIIDKMREEKLAHDKCCVSYNSINESSENNRSTNSPPTLTFLLKELDTVKEQNKNYAKMLEDQKETIALLTKRLTAWEEWYKNEHAVHNTMLNNNNNIYPASSLQYSTHENNQHMPSIPYNLLDNEETPIRHNLHNNNYFREHVHELQLSSSSESSSSLESSSTHSELDTKAKQKHTSSKSKHVHSSARKLIAKEAALLEMAAAEEVAAKVALEQWMKEQIQSNNHEHEN